MPMLCSMANSFLRVITLVRTELTKFAMPIIPMMILSAPPIVMIREVRSSKELV